eukprot:gnl/Chilomastix_cuspidata/4884.p1 GENE.gnl/Chilomastix_cuspidata/4884~~gnl/Chilomastix_cuspidata/4884.p1  ORF type:complete len:5094 (-),score=1600.82 gnl/Chilomastix_cuspidata/4884:59-15277(-)
MEQQVFFLRSLIALQPCFMGHDIDESLETQSRKIYRFLVDPKIISLFAFPTSQKKCLLSFYPPSQYICGIVCFVKQLKHISTSNQFFSDLMIVSISEDMFGDIGYFVKGFSIPLAISVRSFLSSSGLAAANSLNSFDSALSIVSASKSSAKLTIPAIVQRIEAAGYSLCRESILRDDEEPGILDFWDENLFSFAENVLRTWNSQISAFMKHGFVTMRHHTFRHELQPARSQAMLNFHWSRLLQMTGGLSSFPFPSLFAASASSLKKSKLDALYERLGKTDDIKRSTLAQTSARVYICDKGYFELPTFPKFDSPFSQIAPLIPSDFSSIFSVSDIEDCFLKAMSHIKGSFGSFIPSISKDYLKVLLKPGSNSFLLHFHAWMWRTDVLVSLLSQISSPTAQVVMGILEAKNSQILTQTSKLLRNFNEAILEAREMCCVMGTILPFILRIHTSSSNNQTKQISIIKKTSRPKFLEVPSNFPEAMSTKNFNVIFHIIGTALIHTKKINNERFSELFRQIFYDVIFACQRYIGTDEMFLLVPESYLNNLQLVLDLLDKMKSRFFFAKTHQFPNSGSIFGERSIISTIDVFITRLRDLRTLLDFYIDFLPMSVNTSSDFMSEFSKSVVRKIEELGIKKSKRTNSYALLTILNSEPRLPPSPSPKQIDRYNEDKISFNFDKFLSDFVNYFGEKESQITDYIFEEFLAVDITDDMIKEYTGRHRSVGIRFFFRWDLSLFFELFFSLKSLLNRKDIYSNISTIVSDVLTQYTKSALKIASMTRKALFSRSVKTISQLMFPDSGPYTQKIKFVEVLMYRVSIPIRLLKTLGFFTELEASKKAFDAHDKVFGSLLTIRRRVVGHANAFFQSEIIEYISFLVTSGISTPSPAEIFQKIDQFRIPIFPGKENLERDMRYFWKEDLFSKMVVYSYLRYQYIISSSPVATIESISNDDGQIDNSFISFIQTSTFQKVPYSEIIKVITSIPNISEFNSNFLRFYTTLSLPLIEMEYTRQSAITACVHPSFFALKLNVTLSKELYEMGNILIISRFDLCEKIIHHIILLLQIVSGSKVIKAITYDTLIDVIDTLQSISSSTTLKIPSKATNLSELSSMFSQMYDYVTIYKQFRLIRPSLAKIEKTFGYISKSLYLAEQQIIAWVQGMKLFRNVTPFEYFKNVSQVSNPKKGDNTATQIGYNFNNPRFYEAVKIVIRSAMEDSSNCLISQHFNAFKGKLSSLDATVFFLTLKKVFNKNLKQVVFLSNQFEEKLYEVCETLDLPPTSPAFLYYVDHLLGIFYKGCKEFLSIALVFFFWCVSDAFRPVFLIEFLGNDDEYFFFNPPLGDRALSFLMFQQLQTPYRFPIFTLDNLNSLREYTLHQALFEVLGNYISVTLVPQETKTKIIADLCGGKCQQISQTAPNPDSTKKSDIHPLQLQLSKYFSTFGNLSIFVEDDQFLGSFVLHIIECIEGSIEKAIESVQDFAKLDINLRNILPQVDTTPKHDLSEDIEVVKKEIDVLSKFGKSAVAAKKFQNTVTLTNENNILTDCSFFEVNPSSAVFLKQKYAMENIYAFQKPIVDKMEYAVSFLKSIVIDIGKGFSIAKPIGKIVSYSYDEIVEIMEKDQVEQVLRCTKHDVQVNYFDMLDKTNALKLYPPPSVVCVINVMVLINSHKQVYEIYTKLIRSISPITTFLNLSTMSLTKKTLVDLSELPHFWKNISPLIKCFQKMIPEHIDTVKKWLNRAKNRMQTMLGDILGDIAKDPRMLIDDDSLIAEKKWYNVDEAIFEQIEEAYQEYKEKLKMFLDLRSIFQTFSEVVGIELANKVVNTVNFLVDTVHAFIEPLRHANSIIDIFKRKKYVEIGKEDFDLCRAASIIKSKEVASLVGLELLGTVLNPGQSVRNIQNHLKVTYIEFRLQPEEPSNGEAFPFTYQEMRHRILKSFIFTLFVNVYSSIASFCDIINLTQIFEYKHWFSLTNKISYTNEDKNLLQLVEPPPDVPKTKEAVNANLLFYLDLPEHLGLLYDIHSHIIRDSSLFNEGQVVKQYWESVTLESLLPSHVSISDIFYFSQIVYPEMDFSVLFSQRSNCLLPIRFVATSNLFKVALAHGDLLKKSSTAVKPRLFDFITSLQIWLWKYPLFLNELSNCLNFFVRVPDFISLDKNFISYFKIIHDLSNLFQRQLNDSTQIIKGISHEFKIDIDIYSEFLRVLSGRMHVDNDYPFHSFKETPGNYLYVVSKNKETDTNANQNLIFGFTQFIEYLVQLITMCRTVTIQNLEKIIIEKIRKYNIPKRRIRSVTLLFFRMISESVKHPVDCYFDKHIIPAVYKILQNNNKEKVSDWGYLLSLPSILDSKLDSFSQTFNRFSLRSYFSRYEHVSSFHNLTDLVACSESGRYMNLFLFGIYKEYIYSKTGKVLGVNTIFGEAFPFLEPTDLTIEIPISNLAQVFEDYTNISYRKACFSVCMYAFSDLKIIRQTAASDYYYPSVLCVPNMKKPKPLPLALLIPKHVHGLPTSPLDITTHPLQSLLMACWTFTDSYVLLKQTEGEILIEQNFREIPNLLKRILFAFTQLGQLFVVSADSLPINVSFSPVAHIKLAVLDFFLNKLISKANSYIESDNVPSTHAEYLDFSFFDFLLLPFCELKLTGWKRNGDEKVTKHPGFVHLDENLKEVVKCPNFDGIIPFLTSNLTAIIAANTIYSPFTKYANKQITNVVKTYSHLQNFFESSANVNAISRTAELLAFGIIAFDYFKKDEQTTDSKVIISENFNETIAKILQGVSHVTLRQRIAHTRLECTQFLPSIALITEAMSASIAQRCHQRYVFTKSVPPLRIVNLKQLSLQGNFFLSSIKTQIPFEGMFRLAIMVISARLTNSTLLDLSGHPLFKTAPTSYKSIIRLLDIFLFITQPSSLRPILTVGADEAKREAFVEKKFSDSRLSFKGIGEESSSEMSDLPHDLNSDSSFSASTNFDSSEISLDMSNCISAFSQSDEISMSEPTERSVKISKKVNVFEDQSLGRKLETLNRLVNVTFGGDKSQHPFVKMLIKSWKTFLMQIEFIISSSNFVGILTPRGHAPGLTYFFITQIYVSQGLETKRPSMRSFLFNYFENIDRNFGSGFDFMWGGLQQAIVEKKRREDEEQEELSHVIESKVNLSNHFILTKHDAKHARKTMKNLAQATIINNPPVLDLVVSKYIHFFVSDTPELLDSLIPFNYPKLFVPEPNVETIVLSTLIMWASLPVRTKNNFYEINRGVLFPPSLCSSRQYIYPFLLEPCAKVSNILMSSLKQKEYGFSFCSQLLKMVVAYFDAIIIAISPEMFRLISQEQINTIVVFCFFWTLAASNPFVECFKEEQKESDAGASFSFKGGWDSAWETFIQNRQQASDLVSLSPLSPANPAGSFDLDFDLTIPKLDMKGTVLGEGIESSFDGLILPFEGIKEKILREIETMVPANDSPLSWFPVLQEQDQERMVMRLEEWEGIARKLFCFEEDVLIPTITVEMTPYIVLSLFFMHGRNNIIFTTNKMSPSFGPLYFEMFIRLFSLKHCEHLSKFIGSGDIQEITKFSSDIHLIYLALIAVPEATFPVFETQVAKKNSCTFSLINPNSIVEHRQAKTVRETPHSMTETQYSRPLVDEFVEVFEPAARTTTALGISLCDPTFVENAYHFLFFGKTPNSFIRPASEELFHDVTFQNTITMGQIPLQDGNYHPTISFTQFVFLPNELSNHDYMRNIHFNHSALMPPLTFQMYTSFAEHILGHFFSDREFENITPEIISKIVFELIVIVNSIESKQLVSFNEFFTIISFFEAFLSEEMTCEDVWLALYNACCFAISYHPDIEQIVQQEIRRFLIWKSFNKHVPSLSHSNQQLEKMVICFQSAAEHTSSLDPYNEVLESLGQTFKTVRENRTRHSFKGLCFVGNSADSFGSFLSPLWSEGKEITAFFKNYLLFIAPIDTLVLEWPRLYEDIFNDENLIHNSNFAPCRSQMVIYYQLSQRLFAPVNSVSPLGPSSNAAFVTPHDSVLSPRSALVVTPISMPFFQLLQACTAKVTGYMPLHMCIDLPDSFDDGLVTLTKLAIDAYTFVAWTGETAVVYIQEPVSVTEKYFTVLESLVKDSFCPILFNTLNEEQLQRFETFLMISPLLNDQKKTKMNLQWFLYSSGILSNVRFIVHINRDEANLEKWRRFSPKFWKSSYVISFDSTPNLQDSLDLLQASRSASNAQKETEISEMGDKVSGNLFQTLIEAIPFDHVISQSADVAADPLLELRTFDDILERLPHLFSAAGAKRRFFTKEEFNRFKAIAFPQYLIMAVAQVLLDSSKGVEGMSFENIHRVFFQVLLYRAYSLLDEQGNMRHAILQLDTVLANIDTISTSFEKLKVEFVNAEDVLSRTVLGICHDQVQLKKQRTLLAESEAKLQQIVAFLETLEKQMKGHIVFREHIIGVVEGFGAKVDGDEIVGYLQGLGPDVSQAALLIRPLVYAITGKTLDDQRLVAFLRGHLSDPAGFFQNVALFLRKNRLKHEEGLTVYINKIAKASSKIAQSDLSPIPEQREIPHTARDKASEGVPVVLTNASSPDFIPPPIQLASVTGDQSVSVDKRFHALFAAHARQHPLLVPLFFSSLAVLNQVSFFSTHMEQESKLKAVTKIRHQSSGQATSVRRTIDTIHERLKAEMDVHFNGEKTRNKLSEDIAKYEANFKVSRMIEETLHKLRSAYLAREKAMTSFFATMIGDSLVITVFAALFPRLGPAEVSRAFLQALSAMQTAGIPFSKEIVDIASGKDDPARFYESVFSARLLEAAPLGLALVKLLLNDAIFSAVNHRMLQSLGLVSVDVWRLILLQHTVPQTPTVVVESAAVLRDVQLEAQVQLALEESARQSRPMLFSFAREETCAFPPPLAIVELDDPATPAPEVFARIAARALECQQALFEHLARQPEAKILLDGKAQFQVPSTRSNKFFVLPVAVRVAAALRNPWALLPFLDASCRVEWSNHTFADKSGRFVINVEQTFHYRQTLPSYQFADLALACPIRLTLLTTHAAYAAMAETTMFRYNTLPVALRLYAPEEQAPEEILHKFKKKMSLDALQKKVLHEVVLQKPEDVLRDQSFLDLLKTWEAHIE